MAIYPLIQGKRQKVYGEFSDVLIGSVKETPIKNLPKNKKDITTSQFLGTPSLVKKHGLWADTDKDSKINMFDSFPFDSTRHGWWSKVKSAVKSVAGWSPGGSTSTDSGGDLGTGFTSVTYPSGGGTSGGGGGGGSSPSASVTIVDSGGSGGGSGGTITTTELPTTTLPTTTLPTPTPTPLSKLQQSIQQQYQDAGLTQKQAQAIMRRAQMQVESERRGRGFTRLEAERYLGGGKGIKSLREATRRGAHYQEAEEILKREEELRRDGIGTGDTLQDSRQSLLPDKRGGGRYGED